MNIRCIGFNSVYSSSYRVCREPEKGVYMLILTKTSAKFTVEGNEMRVPEGTVILYDGKCRQEYSADDKPLVCDWICFDADGEWEFMNTLGMTVNRPVKYSDSNFISPLIRNIASEYYSFSARRGKMLDALMRTLLVTVSETGCRPEEKVQAAEPHYSSLMELREKIYRNPQLKWNVDTMAADVNMSRSYFQHIYRETFGVSCISDVISGKIEKAKEILSETRCTVSQVAAMCGYDNEEHFMRQFKKIVGVTPTKYRRQV